MEPLWAPEQHTLAFRSNAPTSAHPGQTKSLCAASPLPPRPAPSTDVDPLPPPGGGGLRVGSHLATAGGTWQRGRSGTASTECSHVRGHGAEPSRVPVRQRRHRGAGDGASRAFPCSEKRGPRVSPPAPGSEQHAWHGSGSGPGTDVARWGRRRGQRGDALRAPPPQPRCERSDRAPSKRCRANRAARRPPRARRPRVPPPAVPTSPRGRPTLSVPHASQRGLRSCTLDFIPPRSPPTPPKPARCSVPAPQVCPAPLAVSGVTAPPRGPVPSCRSLREPCAAGQKTGGPAHPHGAAPGRRWSFPTLKFNGKKCRREKQTASVNH